MANKNTPPKRTLLQTERASNDEAAALRKNHVVRPGGAATRHQCQSAPQARHCLASSVRSGSPQSGHGAVSWPPSRCNAQILAQRGEQPVASRTNFMRAPMWASERRSISASVTSANCGMNWRHRWQYTPRCGQASSGSEAISSRVYGTLSMVGPYNGRFLRHPSATKRAM